MAGKGQKFRKYNKKFKFKIINEHIEEGKSARFLGEKYEMSYKTIDT